MKKLFFLLGFLFLAVQAHGMEIVVSLERGTGHGFHYDEKGVPEQGVDGFGSETVRLEFDDLKKSVAIRWNGLTYKGVVIETDKTQMNIMYHTPKGPMMISLFSPDNVGFVTLHQRSNVGRANAVTVPFTFKLIR